MICRSNRHPRIRIRKQHLVSLLLNLQNRLHKSIELLQTGRCCKLCPVTHCPMCIEPRALRLRSNSTSLARHYRSVANLGRPCVLPNLKHTYSYSLFGSVAVKPCYLRVCIWKPWYGLYFYDYILNYEFVIV